jgi:hypothetical protein
MVFCIVSRGDVLAVVESSVDAQDIAAANKGAWILPVPFIGRLIPLHPKRRAELMGQVAA